LAYIIISNNPEVKEKYKQTYFIDGISRDVLIKVRDLIHKGYELISHPLPASIKTMSSPFRSVILTEEKTSSVDPLQLEVIENSIQKLDRHIKLNGIDSKHSDDYKKLDYLFLKSALEESNNLNC